jgi:5-methylcytosine-specific restriction endonuclease McrA
MYEALVLDATYRPIDVIPAERALVLCMSGRAVAVMNYADKVFRSQFLTIAVPKVISLKVYVPIPKHASEVVTNTLLFARDNYMCQYCGKHRNELRKAGRKLTRDHLKPTSKFVGASKSEKKLKANTWENCVTACTKCNSMKGDRTPSEAKMRLISDKAPRRPEGIVFTMYERITDPDWMEFVSPFMKNGYVLES